MFAADILHQHAGFSFLEYGDDLCFGEAGIFHLIFWLHILPESSTCNMSSF